MDHHHIALTFLEKGLHPFYEAQQALEGDQYVSVSLIVFIIKTLHEALLAMHATAASDFQPKLEAEMSVMVTDFESCWGDPITYAPYVVHGFGSHQVGIPTYAYWAALLNPRMKHLTLQLLSQEEAQQIWGDIQTELLCISGEGLVPNTLLVVNRTNVFLMIMAVNIGVR